MHPDKKVGLALGILLIGITGAFFFRNDATAPREDTLTLSDPESLDRKASQKPGAPYFPEQDRRESDQQSELANVPHSLASDVIPGVPHVDSTGYQGIAAAPVNRNSGQRSVEHFADRIAPPPAPGRDLDALDGTLSGRKPSNLGRSPTAVVSALEAGLSRSTQTSGGSQSAIITHEVVAGDNLSRLAEKYLGSHSKYLMLYEANRDQLASPNDLSPGMKLKIPQVREAATDSAVRSPVGDSTSSRTSGDRTGVSKLKKPSFVQPDRESVIALGGTRRSGRSLSQAPPPNLPRVEGLNPGGDPTVIASRPK